MMWGAPRTEAALNYDDVVAVKTLNCIIKSVLKVCRWLRQDLKSDKRSKWKKDEQNASNMMFLDSLDHNLLRFAYDNETR